jgi:tellurite methyltransferase
MGDETIYPADAIRWNERYESEGRQRQEGEPSRLLRAFVHLLPPTGLVLDAAAGVGVNALFVAGQGLPVVALDISEVGLRLLQQRALALGVRVETAVFDLTHPYFPPNCVDVILNFRFLERATFTAYRQALRPGGLLFFETFVHVAEEETPDYFLQPGELHRTFADFETIHYEAAALYGHHPGQGRYVTQLIARKPAGA